MSACIASTAAENACGVCAAFKRSLAFLDAVSVNPAADSQLTDVAWWLVHLGTVDEHRWAHIPVNMARTAVSGVAHAVQGADVGDYLQVTNPPSSFLLPDTVRQLVAGTTEVLGGFHWSIAFHGVPESPYEVGLYGDATYGRADTDGSTLHANAASGATSITVDTTGTAPLWTTAAGDVPFDIGIGGERITVTNVSGGSSPQTFTVTRAVNGVVKAHTAGDDVRLWFPPVWGLS